MVTCFTYNFNLLYGSKPFSELTSNSSKHTLSRYFSIGYGINDMLNSDFIC